MEAAADRSRSATVLDLQAWTYYNLYQTTSWGNLLSDLHVPHEQKALDRHFWCLSCFCLRVSVILPTCSLYPQQKRAYSVLHPQAWTCITECSPLDFRRSSIGPTFLREPSWKYSANYIRGPKSFAQHVLRTFALLDDHCLWFAESRALLWMKKK